MVGLGQRELGHGRVELQLETLQEDRMIDVSFRATPAQDAVSENEFHAFCFAIDAAVERIKRLEDFHCRTSGLFGLHPLIALRFPTLEARGPGRIVGELQCPLPRAVIGFLQSYLNSEEVQWLIQPVSKPYG